MKKLEMFEDILRESKIGEELINTHGENIFDKESPSFSAGYYLNSKIDDLYRLFLSIESRVRNTKENKKENYIKRAIELHGDKFDYTTIEFLPKDKIKLFCNGHKDFILIDKSTHVSKILESSPVGCSICYFNSRRETIEDYVEFCSKVWGNTYSYELITEYKNATFKVPVLCKKHGVFNVNASLHKNRIVGCGKCYYDLSTRKEYTLLKKEAKERYMELKNVRNKGI